MKMEYKGKSSSTGESGSNSRWRMVFIQDYIKIDKYRKGYKRVY